LPALSHFDRAWRRARRSESRCVFGALAESRTFTAPTVMLTPGAGAPRVSTGGMGGRLPPAFTWSYLKFCSSLMGMRMKPALALPSATCTRGSQKRPWYNPYSTPIAVTCAVIGNIIGLTSAGTSSNALGSSSSATVLMSIGTDMRYAARTSWPPLMSNQSEPTATRQLGLRGRTLSSRSRITFPSGSLKLTESPLS
jgi:hypothetical protein